MRVCHQCGAASNPDDRFCRSCGAALFSEGSSGNADPLIGRTIGGSYVLQEIVGVGGMGRVYRAEQTTLGRTVAIKVIHPHLLGDEQTVARFYTEARASSRLNHPNSVSVIDFGRTDDGVLYLAMEFLKGQDLAMVMHEEGPLPFKRICDVLVGVLDALGEAHALDIVHRDLKPENVILRRLRTGQDLVKVVDFGLATIVGGGGTSITRPGLVCGTPDYMSPEQGRGEDVDGRGDLYACGVVLFELLTDQLPFEAETPTKVVLRHINDPVPDPRAVAPHRGIPDSLAEICLRALEKDREKRYQSAAEMGADVRRAREALDANRQEAAYVRCPACATKNPDNMRFCGACGTRLASERVQATSPPKPTPPPLARPSFRPSLGVERPFVGRSEELALIESARDEAQGRIRWVRIEGELGVGKTRLLKEVAERFAEKGDLVVGAGPHPLGAPVPYGPIRTIVAELLEVEPERLGELARNGNAIGDPLTRAGLAELGEPTGLVGGEGQSRAGAVAEALATAVRIASSRRGTRRTLIVLDDLSRCDGLSTEVFRSLGTALKHDSVLLLTADTHTSSEDAEGTRLELVGLDLDEAGLFLSGKAAPDEPSQPTGIPGRRLLPLYLEQIHALGGADAQDETLPPRLADAVAQRVERLPVRARRVLQCVAAFGGRATLEELRAVADPRDLEDMGALVERGLMNLSDHAEVSHPFVAELVEAFIPASARKELHQRILDVVSDRGAPLEVRAEHAYRAVEPMRTLMTLERMGNVALDRGDPRGRDASM